MLTRTPVLLFVFWYCHKRGREVRLEREAKVDSEGRVIELDDDPMLEGAAVPEQQRQRSRESRRSSDKREEHGQRSEGRSSDIEKKDKGKEREVEKENR